MPETTYTSINNKMNSFLTSEDITSYRIRDWNIIVDTSWDTKKININISLQREKLEKDYSNFHIRNSIFGSSNTDFSLLTSLLNASNLYGKANEISDYLLSNKYSLSLMKQRKSKLSWVDDTLVYKCTIKQSKRERLNRIILCLEYLIDEIDKIIK